MQAVSLDYDPYTPTRHVDVDIQWLVIDPDAAGNAEVTEATKADAISKPGQILNEATAPAAKWATLEPGLWRLDGTWDILPDDLTDIDIGYWSTPSGSQGGFLSPAPRLTIDLSEPASSAGFELLFDDMAQVWPASVTIAVYDAEFTLIASDTFFPDGPRLQAALPAENYSHVIVTFNGTGIDNPYHRVRLYHIIFGIGEYLDRHSTVKATWTAGLSPTGETFPSRELVFSFDNSAQKYNFLNPHGIYKYLQDGQIVRSAAIINGERVDMGDHWFLSAQARDGALTAEITATDRALALDNEVWNNGTTGGWTVADALAAILGEEWTIDADAEVLERIVRQCIPLKTTKREAVRLVAQAAMCAVWIDRAGRLVLRDFSTSGPSVDTLTRDELRTMDGITVGEAVDCVILTARNEFEDPPTENEYVAGSGQNVWTVENPLVPPATGDDVAAWLLAMKQSRLRYKLETRGNPAIELGDTVTVYNAYDEAGAAVVTGLTVDYNGGLAETLEGIG